MYTTLRINVKTFGTQNLYQPYYVLMNRNYIVLNIQEEVTPECVVSVLHT